MHHNTGPQSFGSSHPARERLGVAIVAVNGQEMVLRALRALLPQCEALKDLGYQVVVVDHTSTAGVSEAVRRESAKVTVAASASDSFSRGGSGGGGGRRASSTYVRATAKASPTTPAASPNNPNR